MRYEKPELIALGQVMEQVQFLGKGSNSPDCANDPTAAAYESDE